jgi:hypothetical protein
MSKLSKPFIIINSLILFSLILGGTFLVISQNNSGQNLASSSTQSSSISQTSNFSTSSANSPNQSPYLGGAVGGGSSSQISKSSQTQPLFADENHDVVVIEECDLAI